MSNLVKAIVETYTNATELYFHEDNHSSSGADGWRQIDTLEFHCRRKLEREIQDLEFWIPRQADREAKAKYWAQRHKTAYSGDEISTTNLKASVARWKAEAFGLRVMQEELTAAQEAYKELFGAKFSSIEEVTEDIPEDIASVMAELDALDAA